MSDLPEHVRENRRYWDAMADQWVQSGERAWRSEPHWGAWRIPDAEVGLLPSDLTGKDAIELGCGTAYFSAWMARRGATVVGIDNSEAQLATARRLAEEHGLALTLLHGNAERVPYPDASFDFALSEYGAAIWCDPFVWIPEAHRLLRPGGELVFLGNTPLAMVCTPPSGDRVEPVLHRTYFDLHRIDWTGVEVDPGGIEFNLPISGWFRLFRETGFDVLDYRELQPPEGSPDLYNTPAAWARRWPAEQIWRVRKR
ncbi:MAG: class I SAM-dependent methyltransferase [Myxococcota bacterium]